MSHLMDNSDSLLILLEPSWLMWKGEIKCSRIHAGFASKTAHAHASTPMLRHFAVSKYYLTPQGEKLLESLKYSESHF